jgi:hypothetical protein
MFSLVSLKWLSSGRGLAIQMPARVRKTSAQFRRGAREVQRYLPDWLSTGGAGESSTALGYPPRWLIAGVQGKSGTCPPEALPGRLPWDRHQQEPGWQAVGHQT